MTKPSTRTAFSLSMVYGFAFAFNHASYGGYRSRQILQSSNQQDSCHLVFHSETLFLWTFYLRGFLHLWFFGSGSRDPCAIILDNPSSFFSNSFSSLRSLS